MQSVTAPNLKYYGLSSFELETKAVRFLIDPWVIPPDWADATIGDFEDVDAMFITHGAYDHVGDTVPIVESTDAEVYPEPAVADHLVNHAYIALIHGYPIVGTDVERFTERLIEPAVSISMACSA